MIELSSIKSGDGITFRDSTTMKNNINYEIEIEYINSEENNSQNSEEIANKLLRYCSILLCEINDSEIILKKSISKNVISYYNNLIHYKNNNNNSKIASKFIAANAMTLHKINLLKKMFSELFKKIELMLYAVLLLLFNLFSLMYLNLYQKNIYFNISFDHTMVYYVCCVKPVSTTSNTNTRVDS